MALGIYVLKRSTYIFAKNIGLGPEGLKPVLQAEFGSEIRMFLSYRVVNRLSH